jgi:hypothetical protein
MTIYLIFWLATLVFASFIKGKWAQFAFGIAIFVFVGLRYETGFDWHIYKRAFEILAVDPSLEAIVVFSQAFQVELGWLAVMSLVGQVFPEYEFLQAIVSLTFLVSTFKLSRVLGVENAALAIAIAASFILLTLMFSTTRQCFALSIFNFAVIAALNKRWLLMTLLSAFAMSIHVSTIIYIAAMIYAVARPSRLPTSAGVAIMSIVGIGLILAIPSMVNYLPDLLASRVTWYGLDQSFQIISLWYVYFLILGAFIAGYALVAGPKAEYPDDRITFHRRLVIALAVMCMCTYSLDVIRDRISYEMFLLFSIYIAREDLPARLATRSVAVILGLLFSMLNIFAPENRIVFLPYQNYLVVVLTGEKGDGPARQELLNRDFERR